MIKWSKFAKIKKIQKLPAQKSPDRFAKMKADDLAEKAAIKKFGDKPEYMGMRITNPLAEDYATKVENRLFFKSLRTELKTTRKTTATGVKGLRSQGKKPKKFKIKIAKSRGADEAHKAADKKGQAAFTKIVERYTGRAKTSISKNRTIATKRPLTGFDGEQAQSAKFIFESGLEPPNYYKGLSRASRYDPLSRRKKLYRQQFKKKK